MDNNDIILSMYSGGEPIQIIADKFGLNYHQCFQIIRRARVKGIIPKRTFKKKSTNYPCPKTNKPRLLKMYENQEPLSAIAQELSVSIATIRHHIRHAIKTRIITRRAHQKPIDKTRLFEMYQSGDSISVIAQKFSLSLTTIRTHIESAINNKLITRRIVQPVQIVQNIKRGPYQKIKQVPLAKTFLEKKETSELLPSSRLLLFLQILTSADSVSAADIKESLSIRNASFYKYLKEVRQLFPVESVGSIGGNAYYSIDKKAVKTFFNIH